MANHGGREGRPATIPGLVSRLLRAVWGRARGARRAAAPRPTRSPAARRLALWIGLSLLVGLPLLLLATRARSPERGGSSDSTSAGSDTTASSATGAGSAPTTVAPSSSMPDAADEVGGQTISPSTWIAPSSLKPNPTHVFPTKKGYVAFYESRPDVYSVVELDRRGKALGASRKVQVTDCVSAVEIGENIVLAFGRDRNRGEDPEPFMDDLSVWTYALESGALTQTFLVPKQAVLRGAGPRILPRRDGTFSVLWGTYDGYVLSRSFDAAARPVGGLVRSKSYGRNASMLAVTPRGDAYLGILGVEKSAFGSRSLLLLPRIEQGSFPDSKVLVDDIGDGSTQLAVVQASGGSVGVVWHSERETRLWFARVDERGLVGKPVLVRETANGTRMKSFVASDGGFTLLWSEPLQGSTVVAITKDGQVKSPPKPVVTGLLGIPAVVWTGSEWFFADASPSDSACALHVGRISKGMDEVLEYKCAF